ncbi:alpha/beta hydrolase [Sphingorhabdus arenilitoris]|uniref:Alpha/beta hydrolase n=1 Tax=Sphingorhabdus arenilitoris TaxID=1490041 RepID=A0ABV8RCX0_9SPHN
MNSLRLFCIACAMLMLSGCISGIDYGKVPHSILSAGPACNPETNQPEAIAGKSMFAVTSRLPDCTSAPVKLTGFRADKLRYARYMPIHNPAAESAKNGRNVPVSFQAEAAWWDDLAAATKANDGQLLLYVHGFRETFDTSARDSIQIMQMWNGSGPVVQYSWPSEGEFLSYAVDETNMYWDERNFRGFLLELAEKPWVKDIVIISHSLGARLVIPSIEYVDRNAETRESNNISNIIFASPDTDRQEFERDIGRSILSHDKVKAGRRMTLYISENDGALGLSRTLHGYPRLGRPYCFDPFEAARLKAQGLPERCYPKDFRHSGEMALSGLNIVDTSDVSVGRSGHSDYLRSAAACRDFASILQGGPGVTKNREPTHLPYVFRLRPYAKGEKPDHDEACKRR